MKKLLLIGTAIMAMGSMPSSQAATLVGFDMDGQTGFGTSPLGASEIATGLTLTMGLTRGAGVTTTGTAPSGGEVWGGDGFSTTSQAAAITANEYFSFTLTTDAQSSFMFESLTVAYKKSGTISSFAGKWEFSLNGGAFSPTGTSNSVNINSAVGGTGTINLTSVQTIGPGSSVTFRWVIYGNGTMPSATDGAFIYDRNLNAPDLYITGTAIPEPGTVALISFGLLGTVVFRRRLASR